MVSWDISSRRRIVPGRWEWWLYMLHRRTWWIKVWVADIPPWPPITATKRRNYLQIVPCPFFIAHRHIRRVWRWEEQDYFHLNPSAVLSWWTVHCAGDGMERSEKLCPKGPESRASPNRSLLLHVTVCGRHRCRHYVCCHRIHIAKTVFGIDFEFMPLLVGRRPHFHHHRTRETWHMCFDVLLESQCSQLAGTRGNWGKRGWGSSRASTPVSEVESNLLFARFY